MLAILNSLNAHNLPIYQPMLMILVSKCMVHAVWRINSIHGTWRCAMLIPFGANI